MNAEYTPEQRAADNEQWLGERLGDYISPTVKDIVRALVLDGSWALEKATEYRIELSQSNYDGPRHTRTDLVIWLQCTWGKTRGFSRAETWTSVRSEWNLRLAEVQNIVRCEAARGGKS